MMKKEIWFLLGLSFVCIFRADAATFYVTETNDTVHTFSLRGAIIAANQAGGNNTIILGPNPSVPRTLKQKQWIYPLTIWGPDEDAARTGDLDITQGHLTISGSASNVTIDASALGDRVFHVLPKAQLTLKNLTILGGTAPSITYVEPGNGSIFTSLKRNAPHNTATITAIGSAGQGEPGGAIYNAGILSLENCVLTNNFAGPGFLDYLFGFPGGDGGAIYNAGTLTAKNCIIAGNSAGAGSGSDDGGNGGGIKNDGVCTLTDCMISENKGGDGGLPSPLGIGGNGGNGGGICNSGTAALSGCFIAANLGGPGAEGDTSFAPSGHADGDGGNGGGIYNTGSMQISSSTVYGNIGGSGGNDGNFSSTNTAGAGGTGGGIFNLGALSMNNSTVSGNRAGNGGSGADENYVTGGAGGSGGGVYNRGPLQLTSCTISLNETGTGGNAGSFGFYSDGSASLEPGAGGPAGDGGGIFTDGAPTNCFARNTLIALNLTGSGGNAGTITLYPTTPGADIIQLIGNPGANGAGFDVAGGFTSRGFNLISVEDGSIGFTNGLKADRVGSLAVPINPLLGPLQMNGGMTPTHALLPGSPAIDQGNSFHIFTDQRGMRRLRNFPAIPNAHGGDGSDIGAFELQ